MSGWVAYPADDGRPAELIEEAPLLIELEDQAVLTMRTPGHDGELALGFLLSEGILERAEGVELRAIPASDEGGGLVDRVAVQAPGQDLGPVAREKLSRAHAVRASCGLCGRTSPEGLAAGLPELRPQQPQVSLAQLHDMQEVMRHEQRLFARTGGAHAAALFSAAGELWAAREDVGRHNALDKALGACARAGRSLEAGVAVLSGRGGYELVLKALRLGVPIVASVSAPSSLAVALAEEQGQTLVGFLRPGQARIYVDEGRIVQPH